MYSLEVALIHNNDESRLKPMRKVVNELKNSPPNDVSVSVAPEVSWQPSNLSSSFSDRLRWAISNSQTLFLVAKARSRSKRTAWISTLLVGLAGFGVYAISELRDALSGRQFSARHMQVSRKHSLAWRTFLNSGYSDWLLVLEDDALFTTRGPTEFWKVFFEIADQASTDPAFVLVSEGLSLDYLKVKQSDLRRKSDLLQSPAYPFTNTAAAYLINRKMAQHFVETVTNQKSLMANTIDFLINNLLLRLNQKRAEHTLRCHHAVRPPFQNASINGLYRSMLTEEK
jgi:hypothetical protein